jgi:anti-sigma factor RsiW
MNQSCRSTFEESLLSGYVDGELTQSDSQRVRLHLEECPACRALVEDLQQMREAAMTTPFPSPGDDEWRESPRSLASHWVRRMGWVLVILWMLGAGWLAFEGIVQGPAAWYEKALIAILVGGGFLLFLSVLLDRLKVLKSDRYGRVER